MTDPTDQTTPDTGTEALTVHPAIEAVIQHFDALDKSFTEFDVSRDLNVARTALNEPTDADNAGAWAEVLAFALSQGPDHVNPWNTYFGPMASQTYEDGRVLYSPDILGTPKEVVDHWAQRARSVSHPILKARYADLAWDMSQAIGQRKRNPEDARLAIDAYLASLPLREDAFERSPLAIRALDLASLLGDATRLKSARGALLALHRKVVDAGEGAWWFAVNRLLDDKKTGVTDAERASLVADLEALTLRYTDPSVQGFDPHSGRDTAERLIKHYNRQSRSQDIKRLHAMVARAFERAASLGNAMLASAFLQTAMDHYRDAGLADDSRRVRILMETKIGEAGAEMVPFETEIKISFDDMEKFLDLVVTDDLGTSFVRIAREFLLRKKKLEEAVQQTLKQSPLMAHIPQKIMADDFVAATIGSVADDPFGRLFQEAKIRFSLSAVWLDEAFLRFLDRHGVMPEHFVGWANRHGLFEDMALLLEGVRAWYQCEYAKATHILIPQIEVALRSIAHEAGLPVTKAHPKVPETSVAIGMGDILYQDKVTAVLGPNTTLHLQALFVDPRGLNLRNEMAHGLLGAALFL